MATTEREFTPDELRAARAQIDRQEKELHERYHRERAERNRRIQAELDEKYRTEAGMTEEEWDRIQDIIYRYNEERENWALL